ncbi:hypothetical protein HMI54_009288, partial [Coelomomyces lativittatus]
MNSFFLFLLFTSLFTIQLHLIETDPGDDLRLISQPLRPLKVNSVPLEDIENGWNMLNDMGLDEIEAENFYLKDDAGINRNYALVNKIKVDEKKIMPPSEMPMINPNIESPTWRFLVETNAENKEFLFPCKLQIQCYKILDDPYLCFDRKTYLSYNLYPIKQHDHNKYIQVNFVKGAISDMQRLGANKVFMYFYCKKPNLKYFFQNIPMITLKYPEVKSSIPTISNEEYEKWKNIPEDKLIDTPPESYDFSEF